MRGSWLVAVVVILAGCSASRPSADQRPVLHDSLPVQAGTGRELNFVLDGGNKLNWTWTSTVDLRFDVHSHGAEGVLEYAVANGTSGTGSFTAPRSGAFSLLWENAGSLSATLTYAVGYDGRFTSSYAVD